MDPRVLVGVEDCPLPTWWEGLLSFSNKNSEPVTSRILLWPCLGMRSQKMVEHVEKGQDMLFVVTCLAGADVIDDHVADFYPAMFLVS